MMGRFDNGIHELDVRVYYEDTDFSGFVYHANYLRFAERGRSEFLHHCGIDHQHMLAASPPLVFVVTHMDIDFKAPARIGDLLSIRTVYTQIKGARFFVHQKIYCGEALLWQADVTAASVTTSGKPARLSAEFMDKITPHLMQKDHI